jgi:hypothetical protein
MGPSVPSTFVPRVPEVQLVQICAEATDGRAIAATVAATQIREKIFMSLQTPQKVENDIPANART